MRISPYFLEYDSNFKYIIPESVNKEGKWKWHDIYESTCPHGFKIPKEITDRVKTDPENMGINGSLFVMTPSYKQFIKILDDVVRPEVNNLIGDLFKWPEMQYITMAWSGTWTNIDIRFSGLNGYPDLAVLCGIHYAGVKPWSFTNEKTLTRFRKLPDYNFWFDKYKNMVGKKYIKLQKVPKLMRLLRQIEQIKIDKEFII